MKRSFFEKLAIIFLAFSILGGSFSLILFPPKPVHAGWPTIVIADIPGYLKLLWEKAQVYWEKLEKKYRDAVVALVIKKMQDTIIAQIAGDATGNPQYITDWKDFLQNMATDIAFDQTRQYVDEITNGSIDLCSPLSAQLGSYLQIRLQGLYQYYSSNYSRLPLRCHFDDFKRNIRYTADFIERRGWISWGTALSPSVDPYWISLTVQDEFLRKQAQEKELRQTQALASQGFKDNRVCADPSVKTKAEQFCVENEGGESASGYDACVDRVVQTTCTQWETLTPGSLVASAIFDASDANFKYASNVQSAVAAIASVLIAKILDKGINGSRSSTAGNIAADTGDLPPEIKDSIDEKNRQEVADAKQGYQDVIYYIDGVVGPILSANLSLAQGFYQTCPNATISIDDGTTVTQYIVSDLYNALLVFQQTFDQAKSEANTALSTIASLDYSDDAAVVRVITTYGSFVSKYRTIVSGSDQFKAGTQGELELALQAMYDALSRYSCS